MKFGTDPTIENFYMSKQWQQKNLLHSTEKSSGIVYSSPLIPLLHTSGVDLVEVVLLVFDVHVAAAVGICKKSACSYCV